MALKGPEGDGEDILRQEGDEEWVDPMAKAKRKKAARTQQKAAKAARANARQSEPSSTQPMKGPDGGPKRGTRGKGAPRKDLKRGRVPYPSVLVYPGEGTEASSTHVRTRLIEGLNPREIGVTTVRDLRLVGGAGVKVVVSIEAQAEKLLEAVRKELPALTARFPHQRRARVRIHGIPASAQPGDVHQAVFDLITEAQLGWTRERLNTQFAYISNTRTRGNITADYDCDGPVLRVLMAAKRISIHWVACGVSEVLTPRRCFQCLDYGHIARHCPDSYPSCAHCAGRNHDARDCAKKGEEPRCAPCSRSRLRDDHPAFHSGCPSLAKAKARAQHYIDYGSQDRSVERS